MAVRKYKCPECGGMNTKDNSITHNKRQYCFKCYELLEKRKKERELIRIDNALTILKEEEKDIIETVLIQGKKYSILEIKYNRTYKNNGRVERKWNTRYHY